MRLSFAVLLLTILAAPAAVLEIRTPHELKQALQKAAGGDILKIHPGEYPGGNFLSGVAGVTVEAADPAKPPLFKGGKEAWHFTRCPGLTVRNIHCRGQSGNGFNFDDGGPAEPAVKGVTLEDLSVGEIGPEGNFDAIKCSGLEDLTIRRCHIKGWAGQAIDLVGCHRVLITGCTIEGLPGFSQHTGPQFKGGCEDVILEHCAFLNAGMRPIQAGGSTGLDFFRPLGAKFEARRIIIRNNKIEGGDCACAFTGVDGGEFTNNTILYPAKFIFRILTETKVEGFPPARNVKISGNRITFRRAQVQTAVNTGPDTAPETFQFSGNQWYAEDKPAASKLALPVEETGGIYGRRPTP